MGTCANGAGVGRQAGPFLLAIHAGNYQIERAGDPTAAPSGTADNFPTWYQPNNPASDRGPMNQAEQNQLRDRLANDWSRQLEAYGIMGVGTDPDCLKPGGAAGFANENKFDPSRATNPADFPMYSGGGVNPTASYVNSTLGQWQLDGSSEQNALLNHPGNMQLFQLICLGTVTIAASLDAPACAWNIFGTANPLISTGSVTTFALGELISSLLAGEKDKNRAMDQYLVIQQNTKGSGTEIVPVQSMNRDERDGRVSSFNTQFTRLDPFAPVSATNPFIPNFSFSASLTMDSTMTAEQRALVGCGPFYGTRCDSSVLEFDTGGNLIFSPGGGIDISNGEGSAFTMSFPGLEGTRAGWRTTSGEAQPGTIGFEGGERCTRYVPGHEFADEFGLVRLPGCRGAEKFINQAEIDAGTATEIQVLFERGYTPLQDGCVFGPSIAGLNIAAYQRSPDNPSGNTVVDPDTGEVYEQDVQLLRTCNVLSSSMAPTGTPYVSSTTRVFPARTLFHPLAGCENLGPAQFVPDVNAPPDDPTRPDPVQGCLVQNRNFQAEFMDGNAQVFHSEMAVWSWNLLQFLVTTTCNSTSGGDDLNDPDCFQPAIPWAVDRCSFTQPHLCRNVKGILAVAGLNRNDVRAGGNPTYGRRDFIWHSGGELALRYARRNVFGFSMDFAEDRTKTNWGVEFTWIGGVPFLNNNSYDNVSDSEAFNLTVSVDRPTFVNFLNANRTFFINSQWFFQYLSNWEKGFSGPAKGPFNVLFTFAVFTGYYQDRLLPQLVTVYDFNSRSGGFLPTVTYRFTEAFSLTVGVSFFIGRGQLVDMPVRGFAPVGNRAGPNTYENGTENLLSLIRHRDEAFMRIRWTF